MHILSGRNRDEQLIALANSVNKCSLNKNILFWKLWEKTLKGKRDENKESEERKMGKTL